jgi:hypothetical protein
MNNIFLSLLFILTANGFSPGGSGTTISHDTQTTHITQNNTTINDIGKDLEGRDNGLM